MTSSLLRPCAFGSVNLRNRVVMAPLTRLRANAEGIPSAHASTYYGQRCSAGLIVTEATYISPQAIGFLLTPGIHTAAQIKAWQRVTDAVHRSGGTIFLQLSHVGRLAHPTLHGGALPIAPSAIDFSAQVFSPAGMVDAVRPRELRLAEIPHIVQQYAQAAANAMQAEFDGVEIHGASGMLPMQFLHSNANRRNDDYGGSVARRARFMLEVVDACLAATGPHRTGVRLCPGSTYADSADLDPRATYTHLFQELRVRELGYVHLVEGASPKEPDEPLAVQPSYKALARNLLSCGVIAAGGYDRASAETVIDAGLADAVAFGTLYISNPDLVERFAMGWPTAAKPEPSVYYGGGLEAYIGFPATNPAEHRSNGSSDDQSLSSPT